MGTADIGGRGCVDAFSVRLACPQQRGEQRTRSGRGSARPPVCFGERDVLEGDLAPMDRDSVVSGKIVGVAEELAGTVRLAEPTLWSIAHIVLKG